MIRFNDTVLLFELFANPSLFWTTWHTKEDIKREDEIKINRAILFHQGFTEDSIFQPRLTGGRIVWLQENKEGMPVAVLGSMLQKLFRGHSFLSGILKFLRHVEFFSLF